MKKKIINHQYFLEISFYLIRQKCNIENYLLYNHVFIYLYKKYFLYKINYKLDLKVSLVNTNDCHSFLILLQKGSQSFCHFLYRIIFLCHFIILPFFYMFTKFQLIILFLLKSLQKSKKDFIKIYFFIAIYLEFFHLFHNSNENELELNLFVIKMQRYL